MDPPVRLIAVPADSMQLFAVRAESAAYERTPLVESAAFARTPQGNVQNEVRLGDTDEMSSLLSCLLALSFPLWLRLMVPGLYEGVGL